MASSTLRSCGVRRVVVHAVHRKAEGKARRAVRAAQHGHEALERLGQIGQLLLGHVE
jgi:hypothetical protein